MKRMLLVAVAALVTLALWLALGRGGGRGAIRASVPPPDLAGLPERVVAELDVVPAGRDALAAEPAPVDAAVAAPDPAALTKGAASAPSPLRVHGRVLDVHGQGLAGVPLTKASDGVFPIQGATLAVTGAGGAFELELELGGRGSVRLECVDDGRYLTLRAGQVTRQEGAREVLVLAAPAIELAGGVAEVGARPLAGATVAFHVPIEVFAGFPVPLDASVPVSIETRSGDDGRFTGLRIPAVAGAELHVSHAGFRSTSVRAPGEPQIDLWIELEPLTAGEPWLRGIVLHADGTPADGAQVRLDGLATESAEDGTFAFEQEWADPAAPLVAALRGVQPAVLARAGELLQQEFAPAPVRLVLGGPTLSISGKILDADGEPCRGWRVALLDGTIVTLNRVPFDLAEDLARGKKVATRSDRAGAFELEGLLARDYVVQVHDEDSLLMLRSDPVPAGTRELVLRVPADALHARLAGQVVGRDGRPIGGARVGTRLVTAVSGGATSYDNGAGVVSDEDGRFELASVPRRFVLLDVDGEAVIPAVIELEEGAALEDLRLEVARRCHMRVEFAPEGAEAGAAAESAQPDALAALDPEGQELSIYTFQGNGWSSSTRLHLSGLDTHPLGVSEDARTLVFYRAGAELWRVPVTLAPGELSVVKAGGALR